MKESTFWSKIKAALSPEVHAIRIENTAGRGQSDVNMCRRGVEVWVELKIQRGDTLIFQPSQPIFIKRRMSVHGKVAVIAFKSNTDIRMYSAGVCFGTLHEPPRVKNKKIYVKADERYLFHVCRGYDEIEPRLFEWCKNNAF